MCGTKDLYVLALSINLNKKSYAKPESDKGNPLWKKYGGCYLQVAVSKSENSSWPADIFLEVSVLYESLTPNKNADLEFAL